jgi:thiamine-monophosphate kinase
MPLSHQGEFALIEQWAAVLKNGAPSKVLLGIGDDAACLADLKSPVFSCDALIENVHFRQDWMTPRQLGWKSMAVNISDMAAMGATPVAVTVSLALPPQTETAWVEELYRGFAEAAEQFHFSIVGGDTTKSGQIMISIAIIGELMTSRALRRAAAREGDVLLVTGYLGESAAGLAVLQTNGKSCTPFEQRCVEKQLRPQPRIQEIAAALQVGTAVHAAIDISDGLAGDAGHIANRSRLDIGIDAVKIPLSQACQKTAKALNRDALHWALAGGEDYELLLCVDAAAAGDVIAAIQSATQTPVHEVGFCRKPVSGKPQVHLHLDGKPLAVPRSWQHF